MPISFTEFGHGRPLLMLNGYAASAADWEPALLSALATSARLICPDNRGIGNSPPTSADLTVSMMACDVRDLMDHLGVVAADVVGWSMGGFVAQQLAADAPDRVRRLILLSTDMGGPDAERADAGTWSELLDHSGSPHEQAARLLRLIFPPALGRQIYAQFGDAVAAARAALRPETLDAQATAIERWHTQDATDRLAKIAAPALIASGTADVVVPFRNSLLLSAALPGARLDLFDGCGHAFMAQEPERLSAAITEWIAQG